MGALTSSGSQAANCRRSAAEIGANAAVHRQQAARSQVSAYPCAAAAVTRAKPLAVGDDTYRRLTIGRQLA